MWTVQRVVSSGKYLRAYVPEHPNANVHGYVLHHRVVAENTLGRLLAKGEIVHHRNNNARDNRPENLEVMTQADHVKLHLPQASAMVTLKCGHCGQVFDRQRRQTSQTKKGQQSDYCSRSCSAKQQHKRAAACQSPSAQS